ncbi:PHP domain-containing protein [Kribbella sp. CA-293567]|uniref:PHP domain-containing protein n=1 Tax=Kribbella sp. CA-293567 TaxID=3002436 RepID=UPI0022DE63A4|nr:PHP domain-containing protein [Kribbella sp. CA-293567]WBQ03145.1 PHP domain-containing protein [Kribbella sp. CA-293567]
MQLPGDGHVHSEFSWDAGDGAMDLTCARAVELGVPSVAFTEHVDFTPFRAGFLATRFADLVTDGTLHAPELDARGYLESVDRCRAKYPELRILTGLEIGQPQLHGPELTKLLAQGTFDRLVGSLHCLLDGTEYAEPWELYPRYPADEVFRGFLREIPVMVDGSELFEVFAHIDYPIRSWPADARPFDPKDFEDELRQALRSLADGERALEINTRLPLHPTILGWWPEEGGRRITFGSDAHLPAALATGLADAAASASSVGFRPDRKPGDPWRFSN